VNATRVAIALLLLTQILAGQELRRGSVIEVDGLYNLAIATEMVKNAGNCGKLFAYDDKLTEIHYLGCDGKTHHTYDLEKIDPKYKDAYDTSPGFTSDGSGVYVLYGHNPVPHVELAQCFVARFDIDGSYRGVKQLDGDFIACTQLAMLNPNTLVLGAITPDRMPFLGLFQTSGQFIRKVELKGDMTFTDDTKRSLDSSLVFNDEYKFNGYIQASALDNDGAGNVVLIRHSDADTNREAIKEPTVFFTLTRDGDVKRFVLPKSKHQYAVLLATPRPFNGHIVTLWAESDTASEPMKAYLRVYDFEGKQVQESQYNPRLFGSLLFDWNEQRALFFSQGGDQNLKVRPLALAEAVR